MQKFVPPQVMNGVKKKSIKNPEIQQVKSKMCYILTRQQPEPNHKVNQKAVCQVTSEMLGTECVSVCVGQTILFRCECERGCYQVAKVKCGHTGYYRTFIQTFKLLSFRFFTFFIS